MGQDGSTAGIINVVNSQDVPVPIIEESIERVDNSLNTLGVVDLQSSEMPLDLVNSQYNTQQTGEK